MKKKKFQLGRFVMTRGVADKLADDSEFAKFVSRSIRRHAIGDWGDLCKEDIAENEFSLVHGFRLLSVYELNGTKIYLITERDRSVTTVLFPSEY